MDGDVDMLFNIDVSSDVEVLLAVGTVVHDDGCDDDGIVDIWNSAALAASGDSSYFVVILLGVFVVFVGCGNVNSSPGGFCLQ